MRRVRLANGSGFREAAYNSWAHAELKSEARLGAVVRVAADCVLGGGHGAVEEDEGNSEAGELGHSWAVVDCLVL